MKKIFRSIAAILCIGAIMFIAGGEWPENTPRKKAITYDGGALLTALICGLYLGKTNADGKE